MFVSKQSDVYSGEISFALMQFVGIWVPLTGNSKLKIIVYRIYSFSALIIYIYFTFSLLLYILRETEDMDLMIETSLYFTICFVTCVKMITIMIQRKKVIEMIKMLFIEICHARNINESQILRRHSHICRYKVKIKICDPLH